VVGACTGSGEPSNDAADVDDRAGSASAHAGQYGLRQVEHRNHIGLEDAPQVAQHYLLKRAGRPESAVVDEDVHVPVVGVDLLDEPGHGALIGDIERAGLQAPQPQGIESVWSANALLPAKRDG
jgi:hypothetical protein